jgi:hypothetical protein
MGNLETYWNSVDENHRAFVKGGTRSLVSIDTTVFSLYNFRVNKLPPRLHNLHRHAINTCFTERTNTKRETGRVLLLKIMKIKNEIIKNRFRISAS